MGLKRSNKFNYIYSRELDQEVATPKEGLFYCQTADGVRYSQREIDLIQRSGRNITKSIHLVRLIFGGEIVSSQ